MAAMCLRSLRWTIRKGQHEGTGIGWNGSRRPVCRRGTAGRRISGDRRRAPRAAAATSFPARSSFAALSLDPDKDQIDAFDDAYFFVHAAFSHVPGKYRGGEGDDPKTFHSLNLDGTVRLFEAAKRAGTRRCVFLSSRAAYGEHPQATELTETMLAKPETLYGQVKLDAERALAPLSDAGFCRRQPEGNRRLWRSLAEQMGRPHRRLPRRPAGCCPSRERKFTAATSVGR